MQYSGSARAIAVLDRKPSAIRLDSRDSNLTAQEYQGRYSILLPPGAHAVEIMVAALAGDPAVAAGGMVNAASYSRTSVAPGSLVSLFGSNLGTALELAGSLPLPVRLGEATVRVNGYAAPLVAVSPAQINLQVPWELSGETRAVTVGSFTSTTQNVSLDYFNPGIFSVDASGRGQGAILIANTATLANAARPARPGEFISIFATGLGPVSDQPAIGAAAASSPLSSLSTLVAVIIGGKPGVVSFAGLAPGAVGLYQINVEVPANSLAGDAVPVTVSIGGFTSNTVTMAVQ